MNTTSTAKMSRTKWLRRFTLVLFGIFFSCLIAVLGLAYFVLDSERGTQWSLQITQRLLPELTLNETNGTWQHGIHLKGIVWRDDSTDIELDNVELELRWSMLLRGEINLSTLQARTLRIISRGPSNDKPIALPIVFMPLILSTPDLALQRLDIINNDSLFSLHNLHASLRWRATKLQIRTAHIEWQKNQLTASGNLSFRGDYPLRLKGQLTVSQWPGPIAIQTRGNLRKLALQAQSLPPYSLAMTAQLATLDKNLPLQVHAELSKPLAYKLKADRIDIEKGDVTARGDLTHIEGTIALTLRDARYGSTQLNGTALWQPEQLHTQMQWQLADGSLHLQCDTALNKPISTNCSGNADTLALTPWLDGHTAVISSDIKLEGKWLDPKWSFALTLPNIKGQMDSDPIAANIDVSTADGAQWQLQPSSLRIGPNQATGQGQFGKHNQLQMAINLRDLAHLNPQAAGSIAGNIALEGDTTTPTITAQLEGNHLQFADLQLKQARLDLTLPKFGNARGHGHITLQELAIGKLSPFDLTLEISGDRKLQSWKLNALRKANDVTLQCNTQSNTALNEWRLACPNLSGHIRSKTEHDWHNASPLQGYAQIAKMQFELSPFCVRSADMEICLDQMLRYANAKIQPTAAHARGMPLAWIKPWLPDDLKLTNDARISAHAQLKSTAPLAAQASVEIPQTRWRWHTATAIGTTEIDAVHFNAILDEKRALISTSAQSPTIGRINARLAINDPRHQRELDGSIDIVQLQLAGLAWAFQGLDAISGEINGHIGITGTTHAPQLSGKILLKDGNATWAPLGAPFRTVHADLTFDNNSAKLGGWFALGQGGGDIDGNISWDGTGENWKAHLSLVAGGLSAVPLPDSTVVFSPHAELTATPNEMHINGHVDIASAEIQLKQLPPETINVSQDQEIIGQQTPPDAWKIWASLGLNLGDHLHFTGFGADVNLSGQLQLTKKPDDVLQMTGEVKVPRGRYRAYGQRLTVRKGSLIFYGPLDNPDLNLEAVRDMPPGNTDIVGLRVIGSLKTPQALLFSEPSMPDSDIAYYLLTGRKPTTTTAGTSSYSASGALLSLGLAGSESRAGQLTQKFGITDLQLGTSENASGQNEANVSGQLGKDLYVRYGRGLGQQSSSISFQYQLTPKLMIETISGVDDALDLLYSFDVK